LFYREKEKNGIPRDGSKNMKEMEHVGYGGLEYIYLVSVWRKIFRELVVTAAFGCKYNRDSLGFESI
jgi:hypothetical protein